MYHVFNQGNNKGKIFFQERNYAYFLKLTRKFILPNSEILCYCLMPNHFHFLIYTNKKSVEPIQVGALKLQRLTNGFRTLLSSFSQGINKQEKRSGSLFRQRTKFKQVSDNLEYGLTCFNYIHQNPMKANLTSKIEDWKYSSYSEFSIKGPSSICNIKLAEELLDIDLRDFKQESYEALDELIVKSFS